jgi:hypothetical protein
MSLATKLASPPLAVLLSWGLLAANASALSLYMVGNSLTADSRPGSSLPAVAASAGQSLSVGWHVRGNSSLDDIWSNPTQADSFSTTYGKFSDALAGNQWDAVSLQFFDRGTTYLWSDTARVEDFKRLVETNPANANTKYFVYAPWPWYPDGFWQGWDNGVIDSPWQQTNHSLAYSELITNKLNEAHPGRFQMIPVGQAMDAVRDSVLAGTLPGYTSLGQFFRDPVHLNELGQFVASTMVTTVVTRTNPVGLSVPRGSDGWSSATLPDNLALELQRIVWSVALQQKLTGLSPEGDYDRDGDIDTNDRHVWASDFGLGLSPTTDLTNDGVVDSGDLDLILPELNAPVGDYQPGGGLNESDNAAWRAAYGTNLVSADGNRDGVVNAADYTVWRNAVGRQAAVDVTGDGRVDSADVSLWLSQYGWRRDLTTDGNNDGFVNTADYTVWRDAAGSASANGLTVPEPVSACLVALGAACCRRRVRSN